MLRILSHLKESVFYIIIIILLLCLQAVTDLKLPKYTSDIVNVGIQQCGIEEKTPKVIRKKTMDELLALTMSDAEILSNYELLDKTEENIKNYPLLKDEDIYLKNNLSSEKEDALTAYMSEPLLLSYLLSNQDYSQVIKEKLIQSFKEQPIETEGLSAEEVQRREREKAVHISSLENMSLNEIIVTLPQEQAQMVLNSFSDQLTSISDSIMDQGVVQVIKSEYETIGIDTYKTSNQFMIKTGLKMLLVALISVICGISIMLFSSRVAAQFGKRVREKVFKKVSKFSIAEFRKFSTASLITRSTNDIQQLQQLITMMFRVLVYAPIMAIGGIILVATTNNANMIWIIVVAVLFIIFVVALLFAITGKKFMAMQTLLDNLNLVSREILTGQSVIRAFNTQKKEEARFDVANRDLYKNAKYINNVMSLMSPILMISIQLLMMAILWFGAKDINEGIIQVGDMMAFLQYSMQIIMSFLFISMLSIILPRANIAANRINEILDENLSIVDKEEFEIKNFDPNKKGLVEFKDVSFKYPDADTEVITDISFTAEPGKTTAIIGATGCGKSTIVNLIPRYYDVTGGEILVDGVDVRDVKQKDLRSLIGLAPQKGLLFFGTIKSNIKYGKRIDAKTGKLREITDKEMEEAAEIAQAKEFIESKEEKYDTPINQGGTNVSGGQRQRLSIARAIATNPEIYIFDDTFSALDLNTDKALRAALKEKVKNKTVIIVAQRVSTIMDADQIIVMEDGKIVGKGKHEDLLEECDVYKQISLSQLSKEELSKKAEPKEVK